MSAVFSDARVRRTMAPLVTWVADAARTLPSCWLWQPDVVEELVWLHAAWRAAYTDPPQRPGPAASKCRLRTGWNG